MHCTTNSPPNLSCKQQERQQTLSHNILVLLLATHCRGGIVTTSWPEARSHSRPAILEARSHSQAWQLGLISINFHFLTGPRVSLQISLGKSDRLQSWVGTSSRYYFQTSNYGILEPGMGMRPREEWGISYIVLCSDSSFVRSNARTTTAGTERKAYAYWAHRHTHSCHHISNYLDNIIMTGPYVCL